MKNYLLLTLLLATIGVEAADYQFLNIEKTDGTQQSITAVGLTLNYSGETLTATNGSESYTFTLSELNRMYFSNDEVQASTGDDVVNAITDIDNAADTETEIYDMNGRQIPVSEKLRKGVYIFKNGNKTKKVIVK